MKILLVEDEIMYAKILTISIEMKGWESSHVTTINQAKEILQSSTFDVIVMDNRLLDGTSADLCLWIREQDIQIPLVSMSGTPQDILEREHEVMSTISHFFEKPVNLQELFQVLEKLVEKK